MQSVKHPRRNFEFCRDLCDIEAGCMAIGWIKQVDHTGGRCFLKSICDPNNMVHGDHVNMYVQCKLESSFGMTTTKMFRHDVHYRTYLFLYDW